MPFYPQTYSVIPTAMLNLKSGANPWILIIEKLGRYYEIKSQGHTIEKVAKRVLEIFGIEKDVIYSKGRRKIQVAARSLLCYWAVRELGLTATALAKRLGMRQPAVSYAVVRGEQIAKESNCTLVE